MCGKSTKVIGGIGRRKRTWKGGKEEGGSDHGLWSERRRKRGLELGVNKIPIRGGCVGVEKLKRERGEQGFAIFAQI